jgi:hypothetical protein
MNLPRRPHALALAALTLFAAPVALASGGGEEPQDELVSRFAPDHGRDQMLHGHVGIVLPTWDRASQYLAWRAIVTGGKVPPGLKPAARAASDVPAGWSDASKAPPAAIGGVAVPTINANSSFDRPNCSPDAQSFAAIQLAAIQARPDRTKARIDAWIAAQTRVFKLCERDPLEVLAAPDPLVEPLPATEPLYWRQLRDYQAAAAAFYAAHYAQSQQAFARIGHTPAHPMQGWGAYLALRSHLRAVQLPTTPPPKAGAAGRAPVRPEQLADLAALRKEGAAIIADPALAPVHEAAAATLRRAAFLLAPGHRYAELTAMLSDLDADPSREDALDDWQLIGNSGAESVADEHMLEALLGAHPWFDWVSSLPTGADALPATPARAASSACATDCQHANEAFADRKGQAGQRRAWLAEALMFASPPSPALESAAQAVPPQAPEYATVRYYLAGHLAASGRSDAARSMSQGLLAQLKSGKPLSTSAINLVTQQRFGMATSVADASAYLLMFPVASTNPDTGERADPAAAVLAPSDDGIRWLDRSLSVADMLTLATSLKTPSTWRSRIAVAAWMRADLLGDAPAALAAASLVEQWVPALKPAALRYRSTPAGPERQHGLLVSALRQGLSPDLRRYGRDADAAYPAAKPDETVADMWCRIGDDELDADPAATPGPRKSPLQPPEVTADPARRDAERARLLKTRSATGFVGQHVIAWAGSHPADKDLPWLLYVAVQSSRGGCMDPDHTAISKKAWQILHQRFPRSPWTEQTPYFY